MPVRVQAAALSLLFAGCYLSHQREGALDGGPGRDAGRPRDAGPRADAGIDECRRGGAEVVCVADGTPPFLTVGAPTEVTVRVPECHCGGELRCEAEILRPIMGTSPGAIDLRIGICREGRCAACTAPFDVTCTVPPVATAGLYHVHLNGGAQAFELHAMPGPSVPPTPLCQHVGSSGGGLCDFPGSLTAWRPHRVCFADRTPGDHVVIELEADDTSCALEPGPCDLYIGSSPDGARGFEIRPRVRSCDEGASTWGCTGSSGMLRRTCSALAVPPGIYTMNLQDGTPLGTITVTDGPGTMPRCRDVP